jgi:hypothetical protein
MGWELARIPKIAIWHNNCGLFKTTRRRELQANLLTKRNQPYVRRTLEEYHE